MSTISEPQMQAAQMGMAQMASANSYNVGGQANITNAGDQNYLGSLVQVDIVTPFILDATGLIIIIGKCVNAIARNIQDCSLRRFQ